MNTIAAIWKAITIGALVVVFMARSEVADAASGIDVVPPQSTAYGSHFADWAAQWWQFVLSIPLADNPLLDETGAGCAIEKQIGRAHV